MSRSRSTVPWWSKAVNRTSLFFFATSRTRSSPLGPLSRLRVRHWLDVPCSPWPAAFPPGHPLGPPPAVSRSGSAASQVSSSAASRPPSHGSGSGWSLLLSCVTLAFTTSRRFIPTLSSQDWLPHNGHRMQSKIRPARAYLREPRALATRGVSAIAPAAQAPNGGPTEASTIRAIA